MLILASGRYIRHKTTCFSIFRGKTQKNANYSHLGNYSDHNSTMHVIFLFINDIG